MEREHRIGIALLALAMIILVYLPVLVGKPLGWALYAYWSLLGLASLATAWTLEWGDTYG